MQYYQLKLSLHYDYVTVAVMVNDLMTVDGSVVDGNVVILVVYRMDQLAYANIAFGRSNSYWYIYEQCLRIHSLLYRILLVLVQGLLLGYTVLLKKIFFKLMYDKHNLKNISTFG